MKVCVFNRNERLLLYIVLAFVNACGIVRQADEMRMLARCEFRFERLSKAVLAGIDVVDVQGMKDLSIEDSAAIFSALASGRLPLEGTVDVEARNPTSWPAAINRMEWILLIDDIEVATGVVPQRIEIAPNGGTATIPVTFSTDLLMLREGRSVDALINLALNLSGGYGSPSRITVKVKPSIVVGNTTLHYPGFLTLSREFSGGMFH